MTNTLNDAADIASALRRLGFQVTGVADATMDELDKAVWPE